MNGWNVQVLAVKTATVTAPERLHILFGSGDSFGTKSIEFKSVTNKTDL